MAPNAMRALADLPTAPGVAKLIPSGLDHVVERDVLVPVNVLAWRTAKILAVQDIGDLKPTKLMVAEGRTLVVTTRLYVYPVGEKRPRREYSLGMGGYPPGGGTTFLYPKPVGILEPGKPYIVEVDVTLYEIHDTNSDDHFWMPGDKDKVLWRKTLKTIAEEKPWLPEKIQKLIDDEASVPAPPLGEGAK